ncbi:hypothetical protein PHYSODRAFT_412287, partial [Phytophthora sojae]
GIWKWRSEYLNPDPKPHAHRFRALLRVRLRQSYLTIDASYATNVSSSAERRAARIVVNALAANYDPLPIPVVAADTVYVLFFDGGSRGNPGPGGSGSVIVRLDPGARAGVPVWFASMAYGDIRTTNNTAEYRGLLHGLKYANKCGLEPLHVVGD